MKKLLWLLLVSIILGGSGCKRKQGQKKQKLTTAQKNAQKQAITDQNIEELELMDELDDSFFSGGYSSKAAKSGDASDFAWVEVENAQRPREILFDFDQYTIRPDQKKTLQDATAWSQGVVKKGNKIVVEGHADAIGKNRIYNMALSEKRAHTVANELIHQGIAKRNIKVVGRGQEMLKAITELTPSAQQANRRVEFYEIAEISR